MLKELIRLLMAGLKAPALEAHVERLGRQVEILSQQVARLADVAERWELTQPWMVEAPEAPPERQRDQQAEYLRFNPSPDDYAQAEAVIAYYATTGKKLPDFAEVDVFEHYRELVEAGSIQP